MTEPHSDPWKCVNCSQSNSYWADECGRCGQPYVSGLSPTRIAELNTLLNNATHLAQNERDARDAANARIAELESEITSNREAHNRVWAKLSESVTAANARIAELESDHATHIRQLLQDERSDAYTDTIAALEAANARIADMVSELHNAHAKIVEKENERCCAVLDYKEANFLSAASARALASVVKECEEVDYESCSYSMAAHILNVIKKTK